LLNVGNDLLTIEFYLLDHGFDVDGVLCTHVQLHEGVVELEESLLVIESK